MERGGDLAGPPFRGGTSPAYGAAASESRTAIPPPHAAGTTGSDGADPRRPPAHRLALGRHSEHTRRRGRGPVAAPPGTHGARPRDVPPGMEPEPARGRRGECWRRGQEAPLPRTNPPGHRGGGSPPRQDGTGRQSCEVAGG